MYNSYSLYSSTMKAPSFRQPSSSALDRSLIQLELRKPLFLISHQETLKQPFHQGQSYKLNIPQLSEESLAKLQRLERNPFYKNSRIFPKPLERLSPNLEDKHLKGWQSQLQASTTPSNYQDVRDILLNLGAQHLKRQEPYPTLPEEQEGAQKELRVEEILAELGKQYYFDSQHTKVQELKEKSELKTANRQISGIQHYQYSPEIQQVWQRQDREEERQGLSPMKETATIIHQLAEDHMREPKQIISSQVEAFGIPTTEKEQDPIAFWARKEVNEAKRVKEQVTPIQIPSSITLRGVVFGLIPVN